MSTVVDHKFIDQRCHDNGCQLLNAVGDIEESDKLANEAADKIMELTDCIAKAKAILEHGYKDLSLWDQIDRALAALDGK